MDKTLSTIGEMLWTNRGVVGAVLGTVFTIWRTSRLEKVNQSQVNQLQTVSISSQNRIRELEDKVKLLEMELALERQKTSSKDLIIIELQIKLKAALDDLAKCRDSAGKDDNGPTIEVTRF